MEELVVNSCQKHKEQLTTENQLLNDQMKQWKSEVNDHREQLNACQGELVEAKSEKKFLLNIGDKLEDENRSLKSQLKECLNEYSHYKLEFKNAVEHCSVALCEAKNYAGLNFFGLRFGISAGSCRKQLDYQH